MSHETQRCIGFGEHEASCGRPSNTRLNPSGLWCTRCEEARRAHITAQMEACGREMAWPVERRAER